MERWEAHEALHDFVGLEPWHFQYRKGAKHGATRFTIEFSLLQPFKTGPMFELKVSGRPTQLPGSVEWCGEPPLPCPALVGGRTGPARGWVLFGFKIKLCQSATDRPEVEEKTLRLFS